MLSFGSDTVGEDPESSGRQMIQLIRITINKTTDPAIQGIHEWFVDFDGSPEGTAFGVTNDGPRFGADVCNLVKRCWMESIKLR